MIDPDDISAFFESPMTSSQAKKIFTKKYASEEERIKDLIKNTKIHFICAGYAFMEEEGESLIPDFNQFVKPLN